METYAAVVGSSLDDFTKDGIGLTRWVGVLRLELGAVFEVVAHLVVADLVVGEAHVALMSVPGYQEEMAHENETCLQGRPSAIYICKNRRPDRHRLAQTQERCGGRRARIVSPGTWVVSR